MTEEDDAPEAKRHKITPLQGISRSIAACRRCRIKKIKCDQEFPKCSKCTKAGLECVSIDPSTGREVARSYVFHLEEKVLLLEGKLKMHGINIDLDTPLSSLRLDPEELPILPSSVVPLTSALTDKPLSEQVTGQPYLGASLGVSFAKLMMTAVKMNHSLLTMRQEPLNLTLYGTSNIRAAVLPPKSAAMEFIRIYFAQSNAQLPVLHRESFLKWVFEPVYGPWDSRVPLASKYTAINMDTYGPSTLTEENTWFYQYKQILAERLTNVGNDKDVTADISEQIEVPERYHQPLFFLNIVFAIASSVYHLQYLATISEQFKKAALKYVDSTYQTSDPLEQLEAVLLLSVYSIMRPSVPGVWYVLGTALRICVDLGLHTDGLGKNNKFDAFTKDRRRRLFWCTYSLDRQICFYLGRPIGIPDESITTRFPSELDDAFIIEGETKDIDYSDESGGMPSYKSISLCFFRIRKIQLEVQRILYESAELPRRFDNLAQWRCHIHQELEFWRNLTPKTNRKMNCDFNVEFFTLNYNHTLLSLNGLSPKTFKLTPDAYHKVLEALKNLMACYTQLHSKKAINYTWAAVHNLFMAGSSYLFSLYYSMEVRKYNSLFEVKKITEECIYVLNLLSATCDAAKSCTDTFQVLTAAVLKLRYNEEVEGAVLAHSRMVDPPNAVKQLLDGRVNANLANLVEGLAEESSEDNFHLPRFEWISRKDSSSSGGEYPPMTTAMYVEAPNLDTFFLELANLSPVSSIQDASDELSVPGYGLDMVGNGMDEPAPSKDGRRVFEMIQQVPTESIWDQFFAAPKNPNAGLMVTVSPLIKSEPASPHG